MPSLFLHEIIAREVQGLLNPWAHLLTFLGLGLMVIVFSTLDLLSPRPTSGLPRPVWPWRVTAYFTGSVAAFVLIFSAQVFAPMPLETSYGVAVLVFALPHRVFFGRGALLYSLSFALLFFYSYFFAGFTSIVSLAAVYTVGRAWLYKLGRGFG